MPKYRRKPGPVVEAMYYGHPADIRKIGPWISQGPFSWHQEPPNTENPRLHIYAYNLDVWANLRDWIIKDYSHDPPVYKVRAADFENEYQEVKPIDFGGPDPTEGFISEDKIRAKLGDYSTDPLDSPVEGDIVNWDPEASGGDTPSNWDNPEAADESVCGKPTKAAAELIAEKMLSAALRPAFPRHPDYTRGVVTAEGVFEYG